MARHKNRRASNRPSAPLRRSAPRAATPVAARRSTPRLPSLVRLYQPRNTRPTLAPSVLHPPRTVRPLIRTVRTDTKSRFSPPNRRPSPDLANRSLDRLQSWTTYAKNPWNVLQDITLEYTPLHRASACARRGIRREVLHALRLTSGSGSRGTPKSKVSCS